MKNLIIFITALVCLTQAYPIDLCLQNCKLQNSLSEEQCHVSCERQMQLDVTQKPIEIDQIPEHRKNKKNHEENIMEWTLEDFQQKYSEKHEQWEQMLETMPQEKREMIESFKVGKPENQMEWTLEEWQDMANKFRQMRKQHKKLHKETSKPHTPKNKKEENYDHKNNEIKAKWNTFKSVIKSKPEDKQSWTLEDFQQVYMLKKTLFGDFDHFKQWADQKDIEKYDQFMATKPAEKMEWILQDWQQLMLFKQTTFGMQKENNMKRERNPESDKTHKLRDFKQKFKEYMQKRQHHQNKTDLAEDEIMIDEIISEKYIY